MGEAVMGEAAGCCCCCWADLLPDLLPASGLPSLALAFLAGKDFLEGVEDLALVPLALVTVLAPAVETVLAPTTDLAPQEAADLVPAVETETATGAGPVTDACTTATGESKGAGEAKVEMSSCDYDSKRMSRR